MGEAVVVRDPNGVDVTEKAVVNVDRIGDRIAPSDPTWRKPLRWPAPLVVNVGSRNICEIASLLAAGFLRYTDWSYWAVMTGDQSWLKERVWWHLDYADPEDREKKLLAHLLDEADIIHLNGYHTWRFLEEKRSELAGKRMVIHHHGVELRDHTSEVEFAEVDAGYTRIVSTPDLLLSGKHRDTLTWLPSPLDIEEIERNYPRWERDDGGPLYVGHAYTVPENKGSGTFLDIAGKLVAEGIPIEPLHWHGVQRRQSLWLMSQCDVYFATFKYGPGLASYEAMALGIPVLCGCSLTELGKHKESYGVSKVEDLPFIYVSPENCGSWIEMLAADVGLRRHWGEQGRAYVRKFHSIRQVVARLKGIYEKAQPCRSVVYQ